MTDENRDRLLEHSYDGIQEYDNPPPMWLNLILLGSVVFSGAYFVFFHLGASGWSVTEAHEAAVAENLRLRFADMGDLEADEATILSAMSNPEFLAVGASTYKGKCKECHAADGSGQVGPNLTDDYYKNIKTLEDIARVIQDGAANGSMPAWRSRLHPNEIVLTAAYVATLRGKNIPGKKGPEGEVIPPWPSETVAVEATAPTALPAEDQQDETE